MTITVKTNDIEVGRAAVVGIGMVGGSVAAALRKHGWWVTGIDVDEKRAAEALERGVIDAIGVADVDITFIATPVSHIADSALDALQRGGLVTDVGSVKSGVVGRVSHERFVGGHPMAGSEKAGLEGVNPQLFEGATWVLTPDATTSGETYLEVRNVIASLGADVVTLDAAEHDEIVATVSHVPHLAATALMTVAMRRTHDHEILLRLAAGGFRDMTRIAAGHPGLWADIVLENRAPISAGLVRLRDTVEELLAHLEAGDRGDLEAFLAEAATARKDLPLRQGRPSSLSSVSVVIPDRPGSLQEVFACVGESKVNIEDLEINHRISGGQGTLMLTVAAESAERARHTLEAAGFTVGVELL